MSSQPEITVGNNVQMLRFEEFDKKEAIMKFLAFTFPMAHHSLGGLKTSSYPVWTPHQKL